jgi:predicted CoA-binding protein
MTGRIIEDWAEIARIAKSARRIAVLGIKTERQRGQPAFDVPAYLQRAGIEIIPVPVYYPDVTTILGARVVRRVVDAGASIDIANVFRRPVDLHGHLEDLIAAKPSCVWLQSGIRDDAFALRLTHAGIDVVQDRCLMVEHRRDTAL